MQLRNEYDQEVAARREGRATNFVFRAELQTLMLPKMPTELLERYVFEKVSIRGRALATAVQLASSIEGLAKAIENRNGLIDEFRGLPLNQRLNYYLGLRSAEGIIDERYGATVAGIFDQTNDCIFFSRVLAEDLLKYGNRLRGRHLRRLIFGLPKLEGADWTKAATSGLMPSDELYKDWLDGFKHDSSRWRRLIAWPSWPFRNRCARPGSTLSDANVSAAKVRFRPLRDRVIIQRTDAERKTAFGIIVPDIAQDKSQQGQILAIGPGARDKRGRLIPVDLKIGDKVFFGRDAGIEIKIGGVILLVMNEFDVMGIISTH